MNELLQSPADVLAPYVARLRTLGVEGRIILHVNTGFGLANSFDGQFDWTGPNQHQFPQCRTWADVEVAAVRHVARVNAASDRMLSALS